MDFLILWITHCCWLLGVASITSIQNHPLKDNERLQDHIQRRNIFNNTSLMPSMDEISHFDLTTTSGNISVLNGNSAFLVCSVVNLGKNVVSWIRHSDINVLSVGKLKYTQDFRISSLQNDSTWTLKIKKVNKKDEGFYECQISTSPPVGHVIYLKVTDPEITILEGHEGDQFANVGDDLNFTCLVKADYDGGGLQWYHENEEINHYSRGGGVFIITEHNVTATASNLMIKNVTTADSGQYSCSKSAKSRASVTLHVVLNEEYSQPVTFNVGRKTPVRLKFILLMIFIHLCSVTIFRQ